MDLLFCIGNSLVHLRDNEEIYKFLISCKSSLKPGGRLILQTVNYDRVLERDVKSLPTIESKEAGLVFERYYEYIGSEHKIDFRTVLKVEGRELENHELLQPVKSTELKELLNRAGFSRVELYGSFKRENYEPMEYFPLVVVAE